jgi:hypothetical protein
MALEIVGPRSAHAASGASAPALDELLGIIDRHRFSPDPIPGPERERVVTLLKMIALEERKVIA